VVKDLHDNPLTARTVSWSSSDTNVATVDPASSNTNSSGEAATTASSNTASGTASISATTGGVVGSVSLPVTLVSLNAVGDAYTATGNVAIDVASAGVLANDAPSSGLTVAEVQGSAANVGVFVNTATLGLGGVAGRVKLESDGSFRYDPPPGYIGNDHFTYKMTNGSQTSSAATVTVTVSGMVWFVCDGCASTNRGTLLDPFTSIASFSTANAGAAPAPQPGHPVYVRSGTYDGAGDNLMLRNAQNVYGQGVAASAVLTVDAKSVPEFGALAAGVAPVLSPAAGNGVNLASDNTLRSLDVVTSGGGTGIEGGSAIGNLTIGDVDVSGAGRAVHLAGGTLAGNFGTLSSSGGVENLRLVNVNGVLAATGGAMSGAAATAIHVDGGSVSVGYAGSVTHSGTGALLRVQGGHTGTVGLSGALTATGAVGLRFENAAGTYNLTGSAKNFTMTGPNAAVVLVSSPAAAVTFSNGGLAIVTDDGNGFDATGGGTVSVTGAGNTIASTGGIALRVSGTTIGSSGLTFRSISANGGANGIVLSGTGSLGGLVVTGDGATPGSGGTIRNMTGADGAVAGNGIYLNGARGISLSWMQLNDHQNHAVRGLNVVNFALSRSRITGVNGTDPSGNGEGSVYFDELTGSASITYSHIEGGTVHNVSVINSAGTLDRITFSRNAVGANSDLGRHGVFLQPRNAAVMKVTVDNTQFMATREQHFVLHLEGSSTAELIFSSNALSNNHPNPASGGGGVVVTSGSTATATPTLSYSITNNTFRDSNGSALVVAKLLDAGSFRGTISGNTIGLESVANSGSATASGIRVLTAVQGRHTVAITNNTVYQYNENGIVIEAGGIAQTQSGTTTHNAEVHATVSGNTIASPGALMFNVQSGFFLNAGTNQNLGGTPDAYPVCLHLAGNALTGSGAEGGSDFTLRQRFGTTVRLPGYAGANNDNGAVVAFVVGNNDGSPSGLATNNVAGGGGGFVGGVPCTSP
jgi:hypothetical protein